MFEYANEEAVHKLAVKEGKKIEIHEQACEDSRDIYIIKKEIISLYM